MRIGVVLLDHGEPPEYNEHSYYSFRNFATSLIDMGFIPKIVLRFDRGTILQDRNNIYAEKPSPNPALIDAWLHPYKGSAYFIPKAKRLRITRFGIYRKGTKPHYLARKTGPGHGEPDFYEMYGFEIWGFVPLKVEISDRIRIIRGEADPRLFYEKFDESSLTAYARRKIERKVLESLSPESRYAASISRDLGIDQANIMRALKRLERLRLSKFVEHGAKGSKIYKITQRGLEKLTRVNRILQKLHKLNVALPSE